MSGWVYYGRCGSQGAHGRRRLEASPTRKSSPIWQKTTAQKACAFLACVCVDVCLGMDCGVGQRCLKGNKLAGGSGLDHGRLALLLPCMTKGHGHTQCLSCLLLAAWRIWHHTHRAFRACWQPGSQANASSSRRLGSSQGWKGGP